MAAFDFSFDEDFIKSLGSLAQVERYAPQMINESLPIVEKRLVANLQSHRISGDLIRSIKIKKCKKIKNGGYYGAVFPAGKSEDGATNAEKLIDLEYGTSHQAATGVLAKAVQDSMEDVKAKMQEVFEREALKDL